MNTWTAVVSLGVVAGFAASAVADNDHHNNSRKRVFRAQLASYNEVPALSTPARGEFYAIVNQAGTAFTYWLSYSDIPSRATQSHIHFGQHHTSGGISVWLCKSETNAPADATLAALTPDCAAQTTSKPLTAVISAEDVVGPAGQGIGPNEFAELLAAMRAGAAYVNVHSTQFGPGEIRGQLD
jgi:hypothetical protein